MIKSRINVLLAAFGVSAAALAVSGSDHDVSVTDYYCVTNQPKPYTVKIRATDTNAIFREGGVKRFDIDTQAGTCKYTENSGDTFVFHMR